MERIYPDKEPVKLEADGFSKKRYVKPAIIHELELEARAGSPLSISPLDDVTGLFDLETND